MFGFRETRMHSSVLMLETCWVVLDLGYVRKDLEWLWFKSLERKCVWVLEKKRMDVLVEFVKAEWPLENLEMKMEF